MLLISTAGNTKNRMRWVQGLFNPKNTRFVTVHDTGWALVEDISLGKRYRISLKEKDGQLWVKTPLEVIGQNLPEGWDLLDGCEMSTTKPVIDRSGNTFVTLRNEAYAQTFRFKPATDEWKAYGEPMTNIGHAEIHAIDFTYVIDSSWAFPQQKAYCEPIFETPVDGTEPIDGPSVQMIRPPGDTVVFEATGELPSLHPHGACVARVVVDYPDTWVEVTDLMKGKQTLLDIQGISTWLP